MKKELEEVIQKLNQEFVLLTEYRVALINEKDFSGALKIIDHEKQIIDIGFNLYEKRLTQVNSLVDIVDNYRDKYVKMDPDNGY